MASEATNPLDILDGAAARPRSLTILRFQAIALVMSGALSGAIGLSALNPVSPQVQSADDLACRTMGIGPECVAVIVEPSPSAPSSSGQNTRFRSLPGVSVIPKTNARSGSAASLQPGVPRVNMPKSDVAGFVGRTDPRKAQTGPAVRQALSDQTAICKSAVQASTSANGFANLCIQFDNDTTEFTNPAWAAKQLENVIRMLERPEVRGAARIELTIAGHANRSGDEANDLRISIARAEKVAEFLRPRVPPNVLIRVEGRGSSEPVSFADPRDGVNRRIEMRVARIATLEPAPPQPPAPPAEPGN